MIPANELALFALAALVMVLTPGPNMVYLISRSLCQGRGAGVTSLFGVAAGFLVHMFAAAAGITVNIVREANDGYWENVWLKKPFNGCDWFGRATCDWLYSTVYATGAPWNNTHWSNARFDELVAMAAAETDAAVRRKLYAETQQIIHDDGGVILVAFANYISALSNKVQHGQVGGIMPSDNMRMTERWWMVS